MKHKMNPRAWSTRVLSALILGCALFGASSTLVGCGDEARVAGPPPDASGAPPAGGDPKEYAAQMERIKKGLPATNGPGGGPPAPGGPPMPGTPR